MKKSYILKSRDYKSLAACRYWLRKNAPDSPPPPYTPGKLITDDETLLTVKLWAKETITLAETVFKRKFKDKTGELSLDFKGYQAWLLYDDGLWIETLTRQQYKLTPLSNTIWRETFTALGRLSELQDKMTVKRRKRLKVS